MNNQRQAEDDAAAGGGGAGLIVGNAFTIDLGQAIRGERSYRVQDLIQELRANTTLTDLTVHFFSYTPHEQAHLHQVLVQFLVHEYIGNPSRSSHLRKLTLRSAHQVGLLSVVRQFASAAAASATIHRLCFDGVNCLSAQGLVNFCRANNSSNSNARNSGKVIELQNVSFFSDNSAAAAPNLPHRAGATQNSSTTSIDRLLLDQVWFQGDPTDAVQYLKPTDRLVLGALHFDFPGGVETRTVSSLLKSPGAKRLELLPSCTLESCRTALATGRDALEELSISLCYVQDRERKTHVLERSILEMPQLKSLRVTLPAHLSIGPEEKKRIVRAVDACGTLTEVHVEDVWNNSFTPGELRMLREGRTGRNRSLQQFLTFPDNFAPRDLLKLVPRLKNCHTGRFQLVRNLPTAYFQGNQS